MWGYGGFVAVIPTCSRTTYNTLLACFQRTTKRGVAPLLHTPAICLGDVRQVGR